MMSESFYEKAFVAKGVSQGPFHVLDLLLGHFPGDFFIVGFGPRRLGKGFENAFQF